MTMSIAVHFLRAFRGGRDGEGGGGGMQALDLLLHLGSMFKKLVINVCQFLVTIMVVFDPVCARDRACVMCVCMC